MQASVSCVYKALGASVAVGENTWVLTATKNLLCLPENTWPSFPSSSVLTILFSFSCPYCRESVSQHTLPPCLTSACMSERTFLGHPHIGVSGWWHFRVLRNTHIDTSAFSHSFCKVSQTFVSVCSFVYFLRQTLVSRLVLIPWIYVTSSKACLGLNYQVFLRACHTVGTQ